MRSARKAGQSGTRYRAHNGGPLKGRPIVRSNRSRQAYRQATRIRQRLEREALAKRNSQARMEEPTARTFFAHLPDVVTIALDILKGGKRYV